MRCKCGSAKNVKRRFRDKEWMCGECYRAVWSTMEDWYDVTRLNPRVDQESLEEWLEEHKDD